jgi:hypothetical protein
MDADHRSPATTEADRRVEAIELPADVLHPCAAPRCRELTLRRHCPKHHTAEDRAQLQALTDAIDRATELEESWRAARLRVMELKRAAGIAQHEAA